MEVYKPIYVSRYSPSWSNGKKMEGGLFRGLLLNLHPVVVNVIIIIYTYFIF